MMQQAVSNTAQPSTMASLATTLSLNRTFVLKKMNKLFKTFSDYLEQVSVLNKIENRNLIKLRDKLISQIVSLEKIANSNFNAIACSSIEASLEKLIQDVHKASLENKQFVLDPLIEPLVMKNKCKNEADTLSPTFYENRFGFSEANLLNSQFNDPLTRCKSRNGHHLINKNKLLSSHFANFNQPNRGFKTKQQQEEDPNSFKNIFSSFSNVKESKDIEKKLGSSLGGYTSKTKLGSIFGDNKQNSLLGVDEKVKMAFVEGFMLRHNKEKSRQSALSRFFNFVFIVGLIYLIINTVSISIPSSNNGKNNGGINIRSLTGNVNFEVNPETVSVKFDDVKGLPEAKKELTEIVDFLKDPDRYTKLGARLPKGVLLVGPPGCGKTLLAKSVAGEAGVPFFQASGSDFDEMFVGTGSKRVRQLFASARSRAPCVIFIDEIDSVGSTRTNSMIHPHANQTINQLLAEMDGFQKNEGVIVLGATNRRETLDSALMRPGRFDVEVRIDKPDLNARVEILEFYLDKVARDKDVDVNYLARRLTGLGGSSIENVVNQAALRAVVTNSKTVKMTHLDWALDRTLMGYGKSRLTNEECNKNTAYHEAGHVLVAYYTKDSTPLHKVTILPRAQSLGHTAFVLENDEFSQTKSQLLAQLDVSMGGRVAEELAFGIEKVTTGASGDFQTATRIATTMVKSLGMSDKIGVRNFQEDKTLSPHTQELIDGEIKRLLQESYDRAKDILNKHSVELKLIADALLVHETLDADQIKSLIEKHKL